MKIISLAHSFAAILLGSATLVFVASANDEVTARSAAGVPYVSGGVGEESIDRLNAIVGKFNLKLVFALKSGAYLNDVRVTITDASGKALVDATSKGPWFLTKLPAGNYHIVASFEGKAITRQITVGTAKLETIDLQWATE